MNEKISGNTYTLHNQVEIPCVGFGTWQVPDGETAANAVMHAIEAGYTHIDTAIAYHNEIGVGAGIRMSGVAREKLFVTSKLWNDVRGYDETLKEFGNSLKRLNMDYLDLFLIHWPRPIAFRDNYEEVNRETWRAFEHLLNEGYVRAIGVSNFLPKHLKALLKSAKVVPMIDQIEFHPGWMQPEAVSFCEEHGILVEAWSPLGSGKLLSDPALVALAEKYNRSAAQICLRWCLQKGKLPLPKSTTPARIEENLRLFDFQISKEDSDLIDGLACVGRTGSDPDNARFESDFYYLVEKGGCREIDNLKQGSL